MSAIATRWSSQSPWVSVLAAKRISPMEIANDISKCIGFIIETTDYPRKCNSDTMETSNHHIWVCSLLNGDRQQLITWVRVLATRWKQPITTSKCIGYKLETVNHHKRVYWLQNGDSQPHECIVYQIKTANHTSECIEYKIETNNHHEWIYWLLNREPITWVSVSTTYWINPIARVSVFDA